jgi:hypothetical protein
MQRRYERLCACPFLFFAFSILDRFFTGLNDSDNNNTVSIVIDKEMNMVGKLF